MLYYQANLSFSQFKQFFILYFNKPFISFHEYFHIFLKFLFFINFIIMFKKLNFIYYTLK